MINLNMLPIGATLLAPSYLHPQIRKEILRNQTGKIGLRIFSLHNWLSTYTDVEVASVYQTLYEYKKKIANILDELTIYKEIAQSSTFLKECYDFLDTLYFWDIPLHKLLQQTPAQREIYHILQLLDGLSTPSYAVKRALKNIRHLDLSSLFIWDTYTTIEDKNILFTLFEQGAQHLKTQKYDEVEKYFFHAVNKRQEIEACAQYIIEHGLQAEDIQITLANISYKPIITQVFERYEIPFTILHTSHTSIITKRFIALFEYYLHPDTEHLFSCMDTNLFHVDGLQKMREYIEIFESDIFHPFQHLQKIDSIGHILDPIELEKLKQLEKQAEAVRLQLLETLITIVYPGSYKEFLIFAVSLVQNSISSLSKDKSVFLQIEDILKDVFPYINSREDVAFFLPFIENVSKSAQIKELKGVLITDLQQSCMDKKHHFMLGCTQKDYPAFKTKKGIFDEYYYAQLKDYPTMEERYQFYLKELDQLLYTSKYLYISYPLGTYEGKAMEAALEIEQFMNQRSIAYPLHTNYMDYCNAYTMSRNLAEQLFVKEGYIYGSISALERYVKCPFSYFLRYGLSIREPMKHGFPNSYAGTLFHYILESLVELHGKAYTQSTVEKIEELLQKEIQVMEDVFPALEMKLENVKTRIQTSITQTLQILDEFEQHSFLHPDKEFCEYEFLYKIPLTSMVQLALRGFIDRIDQSDEFACILDYKSSSKTLSEANVFAALQLQLLTYSIVVKKELHKQVLGAYYVSLKNENINYTAGRVSRRKPAAYLPSSKEEFQEIRMKAHRFNGWTMHRDISVLDDTGSHIVGISQNKDGEIKPRKLYDLDTIEQYFTTMYQRIGTRILDGDIRCNPMEDACMFCNYHEICRFKGMYAEKAAFIEPDERLYQQAKGSDDDA